MSHISTVELQIKSVEALRRAAERCGLELVESVDGYWWYGSDVANSSVRNKQCDYVLRVKDYDKDRRVRGAPYEVGVVADGQGGYSLQYDGFCGANGLMAKAGEDCVSVKRYYLAEAAKLEARRRGYSASETVVNGKIKITLRKM